MMPNGEPGDRNRRPSAACGNGAGSQPRRQSSTVSIGSLAVWSPRPASARPRVHRRHLDRRPKPPGSQRRSISHGRLVCHWRPTPSRCGGYGGDRLLRDPPSVSIPLADTATATLDVFVDEDGAVQVVEDGTFDVVRKQGDALVEAGSCARHRTTFEAPASTPLEWDRQRRGSGSGRADPGYLPGAAGLPVAHPPMGWWCTGIAVVGVGALPRPGSLRRSAVPRPLGRDVLIARLAKVAGVICSAIGELGPAFVWVRGPGAAQVHATSSGSTIAPPTETRTGGAREVDAGTGEFGGRGQRGDEAASCLIGAVGSRPVPDRAGESTWIQSSGKWLLATTASAARVRRDAASAAWSIGDCLAVLSTRHTRSSID